MADSSFGSNSATGGTGANNGQGKGGAIFVLDGATVTGTNVTFTNNAAADDAGTDGDNDNTFGSATFTANSLPVANDDTDTTDEDQPVDINVLENDSDDDNDPLTLSIGDAPTNGTAVVDNNDTPGNPSDDTITYTPNDNFSGSDSFTYQIDDGKGGTDTAQVDVTINPGNDPPTATDDTTTANQNTALNIPVATLLANDSDPNSDPNEDSLSITAVANATNGTAVLNNNGTASNTSDDFVRFTPNSGFSGNASFEYTLRDGEGGTDTGLVSVEVGKNLNGGNGNDTLTGTPGNDRLNGSNGNDSLSGLGGDDVLLGSNGNDNLNGGAGNDRLEGSNGNDTLTGEDGNDTLLGDNGNDSLTGGNGNDTLTGGNNNDTLTGNSGDDRLRGGLNNDSLNGGTGNDLFILAQAEGTDTVQDFEDGSDRFGLAGGLSFGQLSIAQSGANTLIKTTATNEVLASLTGINSSLIGAADFTTV